MADSESMWDSFVNWVQGKPKAAQVDCPACVEKCKERLKQLEEEAKKLVDDHGDPIGNADEINRKITLSYAELYDRRPDLHWAGAAAYVSKQAGCNMRHAQSIIDDDRPGTIGKIIRNLPEDQNANFAKKAMDKLAKGGAATSVEGVGAVSKSMATSTKRLFVKGNQAIFSDIFPKYKLFEENPECLTKYGSELKIDQKMIDGFKKYQQGDLHGAMIDHAYYEQKNILQDSVFDTWGNFADKMAFKASVVGNENETVRQLDPFGYTMAPQVSFTPECTASNPLFMIAAPGDFTEFDPRWKTAVNTLEKYHDLTTHTAPETMREGIRQIRDNMSSNNLPTFPQKTVTGRIVK